MDPSVLAAQLLDNSVTAENGCREWTGLRDAHGYGRVYVGNGKVELAHRVSWRLNRGEIPPGLCVLHQCDNPPCWWPEHLFLGTRGDNCRDMVSKGRQWLQKHPERRPICPDHLRARGEHHHATKLTDAQVVEIRNRFAQGTLRVRLAKEYGISQGHVGGIISGKYRKRLPGPIFPRSATQES